MYLSHRLLTSMISSAFSLSFRVPVVPDPEPNDPRPARCAIVNVKSHSFENIAQECSAGPTRMNDYPSTETPDVGNVRGTVRRPGKRWAGLFRAT
jgi:hypothetical protein